MTMAGDAVALLQALPMPSALFAIEQHGQLLDCNPAFTREFGACGARHERTAFEQSFETFTESGAPDEPASGQHSYQEVYAPDSGRSYAFAWTRVCLDSGEALLLAVTQLTELQQSLRRQDALQAQLLTTSHALSASEIVTTLAHELNQPLAATLNYLDTASGALDGGDLSRAQKAMRRAHDQAEHAAAVIARVREFVRSREPVLKPESLHELFPQVVELLRHEAHTQRVRIHQKMEDALPPVLVDAVMIKQVLANLVRNAIEAMHATPPDRRLATVTARRDAEGRVQVRVSDQGPGIDSEAAQKLFAPLYTTKPRGMGVGLALCRSIIEFHQGRLYLDPDSRTGATFVFTLIPVADTKGASS